MSMNDSISLESIGTTNFKARVQADDFLSRLRDEFIGGERYRPARLAIARSLADEEPLSPANVAKWSTEGEGARPIRGQNLFDDRALWAVAIATLWGQPIETPGLFRKIVEAHWNRGAKLLEADLSDAGKKRHMFLASVLRRLGDPATETENDRHEHHYGGVVKVMFGELGIELRTNRVHEIAVNAPGLSPHFALMGKTRSGKTRSGLAIAKQLIQQCDVPMLVIDPKGSFVRDRNLLAVPDWGDQTLAERYFPGIKPLDAQVGPVPLDFLHLSDSATEGQIAEASIQFANSFMRCVASRGEVQADKIRQATVELFESGRRPLSLDDVRETLHSQYSREKKKPDSLTAKLNTLTSLRLFSPDMSAPEFFKNRWVIGLNRAQEEPRKLVTALVLDALANYMLSLPDAPVDTAGNRALRFVLVIDEAADVLRMKHPALSKLVRQSASKGCSIILLSQNPEDFDQEEDDFLSQMGTIGVFMSAAKSIRSVSYAFGRTLSLEEVNDKELPPGVALVKVAKEDPRKFIAWK